MSAYPVALSCNKAEVFPLFCLFLEIVGITCLPVESLEFPADLAQLLASL